MPRPADRPPSLRRRVFLGRDAVRRGLLTPDQLRSDVWRRLLRGVYADAELPVDHGLMAQAAALIVPASSAITGRSAAWLWGARIAAASDPVDVIASLRRRFGPVSGLRIRTGGLTEDDVVRLGGIAVTSPLRTAWEIAVREELEEAVVLLDALAAIGRINVQGLGRYLARRRGRYGSRRAARAFSLVDGRAESPQESRLRIRLRLGGLPPPTPQHVVTAGGRFIARVDLAWPEAKVAVEYDGGWHADPRQLARDRRRLNALLGHGWLVHHVTAPDMRAMDATISAVRRLLRSRGIA